MREKIEYLNINRRLKLLGKFIFKIKQRNNKTQEKSAQGCDF